MLVFRGSKHTVRSLCEASATAAEWLAAHDRLTRPMSGCLGWWPADAPNPVVSLLKGILGDNINIAILAGVVAGFLREGHARVLQGYSLALTARV